MLINPNIMLALIYSLLEIYYSIAFIVCDLQFPAILLDTA